MCLWFLSKGDIVDPSMKNTVTSLRLPDSLKRFLAWIWKYIVSVGSEWEGLEGEGPREDKGLRKGRGLPWG